MSVFIYDLLVFANLFVYLSLMHGRTTLLID